MKYTGTKAFSANTKLYLGHVYGGMVESLHVIGVGRSSGRMTNSVIPLYLMENLRPKPVYSPSLLAALRRLEATLFSEQKAVSYAAHMTAQVTWQKDEHGWS